jgi:hypothetical protein
MACSVHGQTAVELDEPVDLRQQPGEIGREADE